MNSDIEEYNYWVDGVYYCPDNTIIEDGQVKRLELDKYLLMDWYVLDIENKRLISKRNDCFTDELKDIERIDISNNRKTGEKEVKITCSNERIVVITLDKLGRIIEYSNNKMRVIENFLEYNRVLERIEIPNIKVIGFYALYNKKLKSIIIPEGVTRIGDFAIACNELTNVVIPKNVTSIGRGAFMYNNLMNVTIPEGVAWIGDRAFAYNQLTRVVIPGSVIGIGKDAFTNNCLTSMIISEGVKRIGDNAFCNNKLISVNIPESVTEIGDEAFAYNQIKSMNIPRSVIKVGKDVFLFNRLASLAVLFNEAIDECKYAFDSKVVLIKGGNLFSKTRRKVKKRRI